MASEQPATETTVAPPRSGSTFDTLRGRWRVLLRGGPIIALGLLIIYLSVASPFFLSASNMSNIARQSAINAILAVGMTLVIIGAGIDLSVGATMALSASVAAVAMTYWGLPLPVGILLGLLIGAAVGFLNGVIIAKGRIPDFIATLGMLSVARGVALIVTDGLPVPSYRTGAGVSSSLPPELIWLGSADVLGIPVLAIIALVVVLIGWFILHNTAFGRAIYATGGNREAARVSGINIDRTKILTYTFMGLLAAVAGILLTGRLNSANALMGEGAELQAIAAVVIGGSNLFGGEGGVTGTLIGALIMGVLANGLNLLNVSAFWQRVIMGAVIVFVVIFDQWRRRKFGS
jgi:ribose transport system permease protein